MLSVSQIIILIVSIFFLITAFVTCYVIIKITSTNKKKYWDFVRKYSNNLKKIDEINARYLFYPAINFDQSQTYDDLNHFNEITCQDYLIYQLQNTWGEIIAQIDKVRKNNEKYLQYQNEINQIYQSNSFLQEIGKLKLEKLLAIEQKLLQEKYLKPILNFSLIVTLYFETRNGYCIWSKNDTFDQDDVINLIRRINNKSGNFYNNREIWDVICRVERGKVSRKLRHQIYERDHYQCCQCGSQERLEIDHIVPISKHGKSSYDNLQTLCHKCNQAKGNQ